MTEFCHIIVFIYPFTFTSIYKKYLKKIKATSQQLIYSKSVCMVSVRIVLKQVFVYKKEKYIMNEHNTENNEKESLYSA